MMAQDIPSASDRGDPAPSRSARWVRVAVHGVILFLACALLRDVLTTKGVRLWPDQGFPLLVFGFAVLTAGPAMIRTLTSPTVGWGENLVQDLDPPKRRRLAIFGGTWVGYAALLPHLGFLVATTIALTVSSWALGRTRLWLSAIVAAAVALLVWLAFQRLLYVSLPLGPVDRFLAEALRGI